MERRSFIARMVTTTAGGLAFTANGAGAQSGLAAIAAAPDAALLVTPGMAWGPRADGVELIWAVSRLARGRVELRPRGGAVAVVAADDFGFVPQSAGVMRLRLEGLTPGTTYEWRAVVEAIDGEPAREETPWKAFRTLDPGAAETHFCIWNDTHENHETIRKLHQVTPPADFLLWNGDTCNDWHREEQLVPTLLAPAGLDVSDGRTMLLTHGNHDVRGKFAFRVPDHVAMPGERPFFAFRSGPVAIIGLHTGEDKPDDHPSFQGRVAFQRLREEQAAWLAEVIRQPAIADAPYRVVFCHIPLRWTEEPYPVDYAGGDYDRYARSSRDLWHDALVRWGAQVVISGHTHRPGSLPATAAFPYAQLVGGGPRPEQSTWMEAHADARRLAITMRRTDNGEIVHDVAFPRLG